MKRALAFGEATISDEDDEALSDVERARLATQQSALRRREFVAGRRAARRALTTLLGREVRVTIDRHDDGAPHLRGIDEPIAISITHASTRAFAVVARGDEPLGIDLCEHRDAPRIRRVASRAFPRDDERARALSSDRFACIGWGAKEAICKALRMGMMEQGGVTRIELCSFEPPIATLDGAPLDLALSIREVEEGFVVVAVR